MADVALFLNESSSPEFVNFALHWGYLGILLWFLTIDQLTPVPEELTLLTIGYLSANNVFNPILAAAVSVFAFVAVDIAYFFLAKSGHSLVRRIAREGTWANRYAEKLKTNMGRSIIILCFIPRARMFAPILAGMLSLSFKKFLLYDAGALLLFSVIYIFLGEALHRSLYAWLEELHQLRHGIFALIVLVAGIFLVRHVMRRRRR